MKTIRINGRTYNTGTILCMTLLCIAGLLMIADAAIYINSLAKWESGGIIEYQGGYELSEKRYIRNTNYLFKLDNGDVLEVPCEDAVGADKVFDKELSFKYLANKSVFKPQNHVCISITAADGSELLQSRYIKGEIIAYAAVFMILGIAAVLLSVLPFCNIMDIYKKTTKKTKALSSKLKR